MLVLGRFASLILLKASTAFFSLVTQSKYAVISSFIPLRKPQKADSAWFRFIVTYNITKPPLLTLRCHFPCNLMCTWSVTTRSSQKLNVVEGYSVGYDVDFSVNHT